MTVFRIVAVQLDGPLACEKPLLRVLKLASIDKFFFYRNKPEAFQRDAQNPMTVFQVLLLKNESVVIHY